MQDVFTGMPLCNAHMSAKMQLDRSGLGLQVLQNALAMRTYSPQLAMLQSLAPAASEVRILLQ